MSEWESISFHSDHELWENIEFFIWCAYLYFLKSINRHEGWGGHENYNSPRALHWISTQALLRLSHEKGTVLLGHASSCGIQIDRTLFSSSFMQEWHHADVKKYVCTEHLVYYLPDWLKSLGDSTCTELRKFLSTQNNYNSKYLVIFVISLVA